VGADATSCCPETIVGLPGFTILAAGEYGGELELLVETTAGSVHCAQCGKRAKAHDRREHLLRDVPIGGRATVLVWRKRIWRCPDPSCTVRTCTEQHPLATPRSAVTKRAKMWLARRVSTHAHTVAALARELGLGWGTVMRAVNEVGTPLIDDPARLGDVRGLGVDEHAWQRANAYRSTQFATGIVDLTPGRAARLHDVVRAVPAPCTATGSPNATPNGVPRSKSPHWTRFGYLNALRTHLPRATHLLDAFHVTKLGFTAVDEVRRPRAAGHPGSMRP
jgi:transposase